jgi:predicted fused transcriptional regulator/phosphomethylpyrimidine kinase
MTVNEHARWFRWLAVLIALPVFVGQRIRDRWRHSRAVRAFNAMHPMHKAQVILQIICEHPALRAALVAAVKDELARDLKRAGRR